jgi:hypothetical protein
MIELGLFVVVSAVALTFLTDATSDTMKLVRAARRRSGGRIHVADSKHSAH